MKNSLSRQKIESKGIMTLLLFIFIISSLIIPVAIVNKIVFTIIIFVTLLQIITNRSYTLPTVVPFIILTIFMYGFLNSLVGNSDMNLAIQFILSVFILFLIFTIQYNNIDIEKLIKLSGIVLMIANIIFYMLALNKLSFYGSDIILEKFYKYGLASVGFRGFFGEANLFYSLGTIPFLYLPACLFFKDFLRTKKKITLLIVFFMVETMIVSSSRALVIGFVLCVTTLLFLKFKGLNRVIIGILIIFIISASFKYLYFNSSLFSIDEYSNSVKIGHTISFIHNLTFKKFFLGDGLASYYYSSGISRYVAHTEITVLDMCRYFGFILTFILYYKLIFPVCGLISCKGVSKDNIVIFLTYLIMSVTNPILFNSFGVIVILWYWSVVICEKRGV